MSDRTRRIRREIRYMQSEAAWLQKAAFALQKAEDARHKVADVRKEEPSSYDFSVDGETVSLDDFDEALSEKVQDLRDVIKEKRRIVR